MRALAILAAIAGTASADGIKVDWQHGLVTADGVGVADRHAPNPAVARGTSRRVAEDAARRELAAKLGTLPIATGGTVADKTKDPTVQTRLDRAVAAAIEISAEPETDGAWRVTMAVPIEAIRQAIEGARTLDPAGDHGPPVVVIDGVTAKPAIGWTVGGKHGAVLWAPEIPAWATAAPHVKATKAEHGAIEIAGTDAGDATLFVIVTARP
jgi:hypothetical protein